MLINESILCVMWSRTQLRSASLAFAAALVCVLPVSAQIPRRLNRCLPYPTLADEINDMHQEVETKAAALAGADKPQPKVVIDDVKFDGPIHLQDGDREGLVARLKASRFDAHSSWLEEVQDPWIRGAWTDAGFFKVEASARAEVIKSDASFEHVLLTVHVNEGLQYGLGDLSYRSADPTDHLVFSNEELRSLLYMHEGDIFSAGKVRDAIEAMQQLYGSRGYVDFVVTPLTDIDDERGRISLIMEVNQGKQYRLEKIEVFTSDPLIETLVQSRFRVGDVFSSKLIRNFLVENKSSLPPDVSMDDIDLHRNVKSWTVDLRFNFQTCPQVKE